MTLRDIAEANGVDAPYATVIVDKLVSRGLAERILAEPPAALVALSPADLNLLDEVLIRLVPAIANALTASVIGDERNRPVRHVYGTALEELMGPA